MIFARSNRSTWTLTTAALTVAFLLLAGTAALALVGRLWDALARYLDNGRIELDNLIAERALRPVAIGRRNYLFAGSMPEDGVLPSSIV